MLDHFSRSEIASQKKGKIRPALGPGEALEELRIKLDEAIYLTSACRSPSDNAKVRRRRTAAHLTINPCLPKIKCIGGSAVITEATDAKHITSRVTTVGSIAVAFRVEILVRVRVLEEKA